MDGFTVRMQGLRELDAKLSQLATEDAKRVIQAGLRAGGQVMQAAVAERAPERPELPSGTALPVGALAADIELRMGRDEDGLPAAIVAPGEYTSRAAEWVEYGHRLVKGGQLPWSGVNRKTGKFYRRGGTGHQIGDVPAHSFLRPGFEASAGAAADAAVLKIAEGVEKAASRS